jgi:tRNA U34 5-carboxymethylaminomethyl modifying enzyme MnmG/GidA
MNMSDYKAIKESLHGCSNHSCVIKKPVGMGSNGPCHCLDDKMKLQRFAYIRNEEIKDLQQKLLQSQASEARLMTHITKTNTYHSQIIGNNMDTNWKEWNLMVKKAKENLKSECPLLEDEVIVFVDNELTKLYKRLGYEV